MFAGLCIVDFRGGPFDGYEFAALGPPAKQRVTIPVTREALPRPKGERASRRSQPTSLATYHLQPVRGGWSYVFVRAEAPTEKEKKCVS